jgi:hypothetical protein
MRRPSDYVLVVKVEHDQKPIFPCGRGMKEPRNPNLFNRQLRMADGRNVAFRARTLWAKSRHNLGLC